MSSFSLLVLLSVVFGQAGLTANAGGLSLSMGQSRSGSGSAVVGGGSSVSTNRTVAAAPAAGSLNVNLDQWANKPGQGWQNGDLNKNNSAYHEGDVVPFRLAIEGLSNGTHTIHLNYDFTAGGHEAYDFLASYDVSENPGLCASGGGAVSSMCPSLPAPDSHAFPGDSFSPGPPTHSGLTVNGAIAAAGVSRNLLLYGGTITSITAPTHSGPTNNNSSGDMTVTFTSSGGAALLVWGAHIASSDYWVNGTGDANGAAAVSGAPWHMRTQNLDGSGNKNQDRSIQPSAIIKLVPAIAVTKSCPASATVSDTIQYTIEVSNTGADQLNNITVSDPVLGGDLSGSFADTLAVGASESHNFPYTLTGSPDPVVNTVTVNANGDQEGTAVTDSADCTTDVLFPNLTITKVADAGQVNAGDPIGFTVTLTNSGAGAAYGVTINDPLPGGNGVDWSIDSNTPLGSCSITGSAPTQTLVCGPRTVSAGGSITVHVTSATDATSCGDYNNTASFTTTNDGAGEASDSTTVICPVGITLDKTTENGTTFHVGDTVQYAFLVALESPDDVPLGNVTLTDDTGICDSAPTLVSGDTNGNSLLEQGETWKFTCSHVVTAGDPSLIHNVATVQGTSADERTVSATDDQDVTVIHPAIKITKTVDPDHGAPGDTVTYTYLVENTGDTTLYDISVDDDVMGHIGFITQLDPGKSATITQDFVLPAGNPTLTNVGTATGTDVLGKQVSDDDDAFVTIVEAENPPPSNPPTAFTGSDAARLAVIGGLLLALGIAALFLGRRRRQA